MWKVVAVLLCVGSASLVPDPKDDLGIMIPVLQVNLVLQLVQVLGCKVYEMISFSIALVFKFQILQKQFERMEGRSTWLEAELLTIKAGNYELKTKLEAGTFNMKAENMELKSRLMQGKKNMYFPQKSFSKFHFGTIAQAW